MAVTPVSQIPPAPSARSAAADSSATDPDGFGNMLSGLQAPPETAGGAGSEAAQPPAGRAGRPVGEEQGRAPAGPGKAAKPSDATGAAGA